MFGCGCAGGCSLRTFVGSIEAIVADAVVGMLWLTGTATTGGEKSMPPPVVLPTSTCAADEVDVIFDDDKGGMKTSRSLPDCV